MTHWSYAEMQGAFGLSLDEYIYYGGYPGAVSLIKDPERWRDYIKDSMIDASLVLMHDDSSNIVAASVKKRIFFMCVMFENL